jgi:Phage derived protein Gp49-like (DUF891)
MLERGFRPAGRNLNGHHDRKIAIELQLNLSQKSDDMGTLRCYCLGQRGGFRGWYDSQDADLQAKIDFTLELLAALPNWSRSPFYGELRGACEGLGEIRVDTETVHCRLLGFQGPGKHEFTVLGWFNKSTNADYGAECSKALKRKEGVLKDGERAEVWPVP